MGENVSAHDGFGHSYFSRPWVLMPTAQAGHVQETIDRWKARQYNVAAFVDTPLRLRGVDLHLHHSYPGVWAAANRLARFLDDMLPARLPLVCLFAGDDMDPDPTLPGPEIANQYLQRFPDGLGVMQPCGDPQGAESWASYENRCPADAEALLKCGFVRGQKVPASARICGSAWFGRGWIRQSYGGRGPTDARYWHFYGDESLACVATKLGVMWWRPDLTQHHRHWSFAGGLPKQPYHEKNQVKWEADQRLFAASKAAGFPEGALAHA